MKYQEIETEQDLLKLFNSPPPYEYLVFQNIDLTSANNPIYKFKNCVFLGCKIPDELNKSMEECTIFPALNFPYNPYKSKLYNHESLFDKYIIGSPETYYLCLDNLIFKHYQKFAERPSPSGNDIEEASLLEMLARRLHDNSITDAMFDFLAKFDDDKIIAVMGGHKLERGSPTYNKIANISKQLTEKGYLMISGGGPGAMEATHLGAWFAGKNESDLTKAISILESAKIYTDPYWLDASFRVLEKYPTSDFESLGIPTWLYGHEPPNPFATKIGKYFANSVREDGLLAIAKGGIIFAEGSAGTIQEIFQDITQNHYISYEYSSPMIFLDINFWMEKIPLFPVIRNLSDKRILRNLILSINDSSAEVISEIERFKPKRLQS